MKTILVLGQHPSLAEAVRGALNPEKYRLIHRIDMAEAEPWFGSGLAHACILDADSTQINGLWFIEKLRRRNANCPILVFSDGSWELEEDAYLLGVAQVLSKPVKPRMLNALLERLLVAVPSIAPKAPASATPAANRPPKPAEGVPTQMRTLEVLRDFSAILTHTLCAEALLKQFLLLLREILAINRAAIFLRQSASSFGEVASPEVSRRLCSACAIGLAPGLLEHFELSYEAGIGGYLFRQGRILRRESDEVQADLEMQKEFELLGAEVAVPILDRESLIGVAVFDGRVTGESLSNYELELIFHLLEQLGLAIKNIWLHDQVAANHEMMANILRQLSSACIVVGRDLNLLHSNQAARGVFSRPGRRNAELEFSDLPQVLGSKVYQVLKTGSGIATFKYSPPDKPHSVYHITIMPFQKQNSAIPNSALLVMEDFTQTEQLQRLEIEAANLRLVKTMAERLAHEVGNALVPVSTHQQLLGERFGDLEFRVSLNSALTDSVKRVTRLVNQMLFLARDSVLTKDAIPLGQLIEDAFNEAQRHQPSKSCLLKYENGHQPIVLAGERAALKHAMAEVLLNALQANPQDPQIKVRTTTDLDSTGMRWVHVEIFDSGGGFTEEAAQKVPEPFFTTRNVGLGLGLTVSQKIIQTHQGRLEIPPVQKNKAGLVRISLPVETT